ncbi:MAG: hypothetical protein GC180_08485 [Bacteroidetes bacterium]|nr:hypothetical protein [Bacteroidota bacterium]
MMTLNRSRAQNCSLLAIAGSAGSFNDMIEWVKQLTNLTLVIVIHRNNQHKSNLVGLMEYFTKAQVKEAEDDESIQKGTIYIAPAGFHLTVGPNNRWQLLDTEPVWYCKPAIDMLLSSMANQYKENCGAILLSGANEDGAAGLREIREEGGVSLCIHPEQAEYAMMPLAAQKKQSAEFYFKREDIGELAKLFRT